MKSGPSAYALGTFSLPGEPTFPGLVIAERIAPLAALKPVFARLSLKAINASSILELLENWEENSAGVRQLVNFISNADSSGKEWRSLFIPADRLKFYPPVNLPRQVFCAGANYRKHVIDLIVDQGTGMPPNASVEERRAQATKLMDDRAANGAPFVFSKAPSAVTGPFDSVVIPRYARKPDWELELAAVIGKPARYVSCDRALEYVAGFTIVNDITDRDLVFRKDVGAIGADWVASKSSPSYMPMGPYLVPAEFVHDPQNLQVTLKLNGQTMQDESTADMIFSVARIIEALSRYVQLWPGDLIATGSPAGNGTHFNRFLKPSDIMEGSITGLGTQRNECIAEEAEAHAGR